MKREDRRAHSSGSSCLLRVVYHLLREPDFQGCSLSWSWPSAGPSPRSEGFLMERPPAHSGIVLCQAPAQHQGHLVSPVTALRVTAPSLLGVRAGPPSPTSHHHHTSQILLVTKGPQHMKRRVKSRKAVQPLWGSAGGLVSLGRLQPRGCGKEPCAPSPGPCGAQRGNWVPGVPTHVHTCG